MLTQSVDGAGTHWPITSSHSPARSASASSIESPSARSDATRGGGFQPDVGPTRGIAEVHVGVDELPQPEVLGQHHRQQQTAIGHRPVVVEDHLGAVQGVR